MDANLKSSIDEVHRHIVGRAHTIVSTLIDDRSFHSSAASELLLYANQLFKLLPEVSRPTWLGELLSNFDGKELRAGHHNSYSSKFAAFILSNMSSIELPILTPDQVNYDFDRAFDDVREAQDIPATFETLVAKLEQIVAADQIDSRVVQQALERLMALFKRNKHGSLTSILVSLHYGRFVMKAFGGALAANKYLKPMVEAFKEEFAEAEAKVQRAEATLKEEAIRRLTNQERLIAYLEQNGVESSSVVGYLGSSKGNDDIV